MKTKITGSKGSNSNNAVLKGQPPPPHDPQNISDAAMILARQVAYLGLAALGGDEMAPEHALRGLMAAMITVSSEVMDRADVVIWFRSLAEELEDEELSGRRDVPAARVPPVQKVLRRL